MIRDPIDRSLPKGVNKVHIEDPSTGKRLLFSVRKYRKKYAELAKQQELDVQSILNSVNAQFLAIDSSQPYMGEIINFLKKRGVKYR